MFLIACAISVFNCHAQSEGHFTPKVVYQSDDLVITQVSGNAFEHTSFLQTQDFGNVPCNGLIVRDGHEAIVFDTPTEDKGAEELIKWITEALDCKINAVVPTHFHNDCLGGLHVFEENNIPSYAYFKTVELARENKLAVPRHSFKDSLLLQVGARQAVARFFGEGHTRDNIIGYFPSEDIMFGGCLIKELAAGKGYLGDANTMAWSATVRKVKQAYPNVKMIIPGHGTRGDKELLNYTIDLFKIP